MSELPPKARRGCLFYGCVSGLVLLVLAIGLLLLGFHYVKKMVYRYTDAQPMELPTVQLPKAEMDKLQRRFDAFEIALREHRPVQTLTLKPDEINALIANGAGREALQGKLYVGIEGNQLKGQVSVPLQDVGLTLFKGRYLNGSATFSMGLHKGLLVVVPQTVMVKGNPLPELYMAKLRRENLAASLTNEPKAVVMMQSLEDVQIKDGTLVVVPKEKK
jgi:hypothetical protein